jgi:hypothetical protein
MAELHPITFIYEAVDNQLKFSFPYFDNEVRIYDSATTYIGDEDKMEHPVTYQWQHTLGEIISALVGAGLTLDFFHEFPYTVYNMFPGFMVQDDQGKWRLKEKECVGVDFKTSFRFRLKNLNSRDSRDNR